jgi:hypothetical protein
MDREDPSDRGLPKIGRIQKWLRSTINKKRGFL